MDVDEFLSPDAGVQLILPGGGVTLPPSELPADPAALVAVLRSALDANAEGGGGGGGGGGSHAPMPVKAVHTSLAAWYSAACAYAATGRLAAMDYIIREFFAAGMSMLPQYTSAAASAVRVRMLLCAASHELLYGSASSNAAGGVAAAAIASAASAAAGVKLEAGMHTYTESSPLPAAVVSARLQNASNHVMMAEQVNTHIGGNAAPLIDVMRGAIEATRAVHAPDAASREQAMSAADACARRLERAEAEFKRRDASLSNMRSVLLPALMLQAACAVWRGDWVAARAAYARIIVANPAASAHVRVGLGLCLHALGHRDVAVKAFLRALQLQPDNASALACLCALEHKKLADVAPDAACLLAGDADTPRERAATARALLEQLKIAISVSPSHPLALLQMSHAYMNAWLPLTAPRSGAEVTGTLTTGSRRLVFSDDVSTRLRVGETLKLSVHAPAGGAPIFVTVRLASSDAVGLLPLSAVGAAVARNPSLAALPAGAPVCVARLRAPWMGAHVAGVRIFVLDVERSRKTAALALEASHTPSHRAEAAYALGRAHQAAGAYAEAGHQYRTALEAVPSYAPALAGSAAVAIASRQWEEALKLLTSITSATPDDRSAWKQSAGVLMELKRGEEALAAAKRATELAPWDCTAIFLYATLLVQQDSREAVAKARDVCERAIGLFTSSGQQAPSALLNNAGVLAMRLATYAATPTHARSTLLTTALQRLHAAADALLLEVYGDVEEAAPAGDDAARRDVLLYSSPLGTTLAFNIARWHESTGDLNAAAAQYERIVAGQPNYFDCYLRLAVLHWQRGRTTAALRATDDAITACRQVIATLPATSTVVAHARSAVVTALVCRGQIFEARGATPAAMECFAAARAEPESEGDAYASLCIANATFRDIYNSTGSGEEAPGARETSLRSAFDKYKDVLRRFPRNMFAAIGMGNVLAEQGRLAHARDVFTVVRDAGAVVSAAAATVSNVVTCCALGHLAYTADDPNKAITLYTSAMTRALSGDAAVAMSHLLPGGVGRSPAAIVGMANLIGRAAVKKEAPGEAIAVLSRALMLAPEDTRIRYNLAFVKLLEALRIINLPPHERTIGLAESAVAHLKQSFTVLKQVRALLERHNAALAAAEEALHDLTASGAAVSTLEPHRVAQGKARRALAYVGVTPDALGQLMVNEDVLLARATEELHAAQRRVAEQAREAAARKAAHEAREAATVEAAAEAARLAAERKEQEQAAARALQLAFAERAAQLAAESITDNADDRKQRKGGGKRKRAGGSMLDDGGEEEGGDGGGGGAARRPAAKRARDAGGESDSGSSSSSSSDDSSDSDSDSSSSGSSVASGQSEIDKLFAADEEEDADGVPVPTREAGNTAAAAPAAAATGADAAGAATGGAAQLTEEDLFGDGDDDDEPAVSPSAAAPSGGDAPRRRTSGVIQDDDEDV